MVVIRSAAFAIALVTGVILAAPLQAQTTATLSVSARVTEECTIVARSKRELVRIARRLNDPSIITRCSPGVVNRVDRRLVKAARIQAPVRVRSRIGRTVERKPTRGRSADVLLVTVTY